MLSLWHTSTPPDTESASRKRSLHWNERLFFEKRWESVGSICERFGGFNVVEDSLERCSCEPVASIYSPQKTRNELVLEVPKSLEETIRLTSANVATSGLSKRLAGNAGAEIFSLHHRIPQRARRPVIGRQFESWLVRILKYRCAKNGDILRAFSDTIFRYDWSQHPK